MKRWWQTLQPNTRWAIVIFGLIILWFAVSFVRGDKTVDTQASDSLPSQPAVQVVRLTPQPYHPTLRLSAQTEAADKATVAAQTAGRVQALNVSRGDRVQQGQRLAKLDPATRASDVRAAQALADKQAQLVAAGEALVGEGYVAATDLAQRQADLLAAREQLARAKQDLAYTNITSPLNGVVEDTHVVAGDFVNVGDPVATVVQRDEILAVAYVGQEQRAAISTGSSVTVVTLDGQEAPATVRFVATDADPATRTYRVEAVVDGRSYPLPTGMTARMDVTLTPLMAVQVSHSALVLEDDGNVAVVLVNTNDTETPTSHHIPVRLLDDQPGGVWIGGLGDAPATLVVRGQASAPDGATVRLVETTNEQE